MYFNGALYQIQKAKTKVAEKGIIMDNNEKNLNLNTDEGAKEALGNLKEILDIMERDYKLLYMP